MMNNQHVSIKDRVMMLSHASSDIEEAERNTSVSFMSNEENIKNLVTHTATATSVQVKREIMAVSTTPFDIDSEKTKEEEKQDGEWILHTKSTKKNKTKHTSDSWAQQEDEEMDEDEADVESAVRNKREADKMLHANRYGKIASPKKVRIANKKPITNPYMKAAEKTTSAPKASFKPVSSLKDRVQQRSNLANKKINQTINNYLETATQSKRELLNDGFKVRIKFSHTPTYGATNPHEALVHVMSHMKYIDPKAQILPWDESNNNHSGPVASSDLMRNSTTVARNDLKFYADVPASTIQEGYTQGQKIWNMQIHLNTTISPTQFKDVWASKKGDILNAGGIQYMSITMSCIQDAPNSVLIGVAQGSTEGMNEEIINSKLETIVGIPGIRVSYQSIHQPGISKKLWDNANRKADSTKAKRYSRDYLDKKYAWAPEGLGIYVNNVADADAARKKMMTLYGSTDPNGVPPTWPGGECMRFIPLKNSYIKSDKTRAKVDRRFKLHVYLKAQERTVITKFKNINNTIKEDMTFQEYILNIQSEQVDNFKLFRHFKKIWTPDPKQTVWALSVHKSMLHEAETKVALLEDMIQDEFGPEVCQSFIHQQTSRFGRRTNGNAPPKAKMSNDDDWFSDEDEGVDTYEKSGIILEGYEDVFAETHQEMDSDDSLNSSWKFGSTATNGSLKSATTNFSAEDIEPELSGDTEISSITTSVRTEDITGRIKDVTAALCAHHKFTVQEINQVTSSSSPYQPFHMMINSTTYNQNDTITAMCNLRQSSIGNENTIKTVLPPEVGRTPSPTEEEMYGS